jgi:hypothetical protein
MPMTTDMRAAVREWLEAEKAGRADEADLHFQAIGRGLERPRLPAGFADAVMARLGAAPRVLDVYSKRWVQAVVAACVTLVGGAAALVPWHFWVDALLASVQGVAWGIGRVVAGGQAWVASGLALWGGLAQAGAVVGRVVLGPAPLGLLALNLAVGMCAFAALRRLMAWQEN